MKRILALAASLIAMVGCSNPVAPSADTAAKVKASLEGASMAKSGRLAAN